MIFYNINSICNNCHFISFSDLHSSENEMTMLATKLMTRWRGDRILKQLILAMRDSEDIKLWPGLSINREPCYDQKQYKCLVKHCIIILYMFYFRSFTTGLYINILFFSWFYRHRSCDSNQVHTGRGYNFNT